MSEYILHVFVCARCRMDTLFLCIHTMINCQTPFHLSNFLHVCMNHIPISCSGDLGGKYSGHALGLSERSV